MARLIYSATASLDGFIAGPGGDMSWLTEHIGGENPTADRVLARTGAILVGRVTFGGGDPNAGTDAEGAFGGQYVGPVVVLTHRPPEAPLSACSPDGVEFATDLPTAVERAKALAGDRDVNVLGADVAAQCLEAGLLDEVLFFVASVILGAGSAIIGRPGGPRVRLERLPGETEHWYRVVR